jgi:hypothetical protein
LLIALVMWVRTVPKPMPRMRAMTVRAAAGNQGGNLTFARRQCAAAAATQQRAPQMRLKRIEQIEIARTKFRTALRRQIRKSPRSRSPSKMNILTPWCKPSRARKSL